MIVGIKEIDLHELAEVINMHESLIEYSVNLVPRIIRHNLAIVNNQKYLVALYVRSMNSVPWKNRKKLCDELLEDVSILGDCTSFVTFEEILREVDFDLLVEILLNKEVVDGHRHGYY